ncbi:MAG TPA: PEPxxWA-CTERM sorting domain-containing protein [Phenylobacterium sp.]|nr:PEPxxWA-CTERM sorting domain-containing protein [Phenylobacterium sp.]HLZ75156.1 PEPxxWA-CTERM sorting domain-containing protein [Phenylobacterium sp.]
MRRISIALAAIAGALGLTAQSAQATPITFIETVNASGMLGADVFSDALVTFTGTADTTDVVGAYQISHLPISVDVAGLGSAAFTDDFLLYANNNGPNIGMGDITTGLALLYVGGPLGGYDLQSNFSLTGISQKNLGASYNTTAGAFSFRTTAETATFQAQLGAVPEPAAWALMISGFGLAGAALRRRRAAFAPA